MKISLNRFRTKQRYKKKVRTLLETKTFTNCMSDTNAPSFNSNEKNQPNGAQSFLYFYLQIGSI